MEKYKNWLVIFTLSCLVVFMWGVIVTSLEILAKHTEEVVVEEKYAAPLPPKVAPSASKCLEWETRDIKGMHLRVCKRWKE